MGQTESSSPTLSPAKEFGCTTLGGTRKTSNFDARTPTGFIARVANTPAQI